MGHRIDPKTLTIQIDLEEKDLDMFYEIQKTMQTPGWAYLQKYWEGTREDLIDLTKSFSNNYKKEGLIRNGVCRIAGYDDHLTVPLKIVALLNKYTEDKAKELEVPDII